MTARIGVNLMDGGVVRRQVHRMATGNPFGVVEIGTPGVSTTIFCDDVASARAFARAFDALADDMELAGMSTQELREAVTGTA